VHKVALPDDQPNNAIATEAHEHQKGEKSAQTWTCRWTLSRKTSRWRSRGWGHSGA